MNLCRLLVKLTRCIFLKKYHGLWNDDSRCELSKVRVNRNARQLCQGERQDGCQRRKADEETDIEHVVVRHTAYGANPSVKSI